MGIVAGDGPGPIPFFGTGGVGVVLTGVLSRFFPGRMGRDGRRWSGGALGGVALAVLFVVAPLTAKGFSGFCSLIGGFYSPVGGFYSLIVGIYSLIGGFGFQQDLVSDALFAVIIGLEETLFALEPRIGDQGAVQKQRIWQPIQGHSMFLGAPSDALFQPLVTAFVEMQG